MGQRTHDALGAGAAAGATIVGLAAFAHVSAGGSLSAGPLVVSVLVAGVLSSLLAARVRLTFGRVLLLSLAAQPLLHAAFGHRSSTNPSHSMTGMHDHAHAVPAVEPSVAGADTRMVLAHLAIALVAAVCVRSGMQWLRSMPGLVRAMLVAARGLVVPVVLPSTRAPRPVVIGIAPLGLALAWDARGPPV